jgi:hypothetical protein
MAKKVIYDCARCKYNLGDEVSLKLHIIPGDENKRIVCAKIYEGNKMFTLHFPNGDGWPISVKEIDGCLYAWQCPKKKDRMLAKKSWDKNLDYQEKK